MVVSIPLHDAFGQNNRQKDALNLTVFSFFRFGALKRWFYVKWIILMIIVSILPHVELRLNDHRVYASHFIDNTYIYIVKAW